MMAEQMLSQWSQLIQNTMSTQAKWKKHLAIVRAKEQLFEHQDFEIQEADNIPLSKTFSLLRSAHNILKVREQALLDRMHGAGMSTSLSTEELVVKHLPNEDLSTETAYSMMIYSLGEVASYLIVEDDAISMLEELVSRKLQQLQKLTILFLKDTVSIICTNARLMDSIHSIEASRSENVEENAACVERLKACRSRMLGAQERYDWWVLHNMAYLGMAVPSRQCFVWEFYQDLRKWESGCSVAVTERRLRREGLALGHEEAGGRQLLITNFCSVVC